MEEKDLNHQRIKKLAEDTINKIAAGEVIQRPMNAVKEMIENSIDAKSTQITVYCVNGGLQLLQITDNGCGISKDDLEIACDRFTTSKLSKYSDLMEISTFGFRGEALASISHISNIKITSKTKYQQCAYKASYESGNLIDIKPCAGNDGTTIAVHNMFHNVPLRLKSFKSDEYQRINDIVQKYAIEYPEISFLCKKQNSTDVQTFPGTSKDQICRLFAVPPKDCLELNEENESLQISLKACISSYKKSLQILFVNGRLVSQNNLKKVVQLLPSTLNYFVYLSLTLPPRNIDVNVHPTKQEVKFLNETEICVWISEKLFEIVNQSKAFNYPIISNEKKDEILSISSLKGGLTSVRASRPSQMVRNDPKIRELDSFLLGKPEVENNNSELKQIKTVELDSILHLRNKLKDEEDFTLTKLLRSSTYVGSFDNYFLIQSGTSLYLLKDFVPKVMYQLLLFHFQNYGVYKFSPISISTQFNSLEVNFVNFKEMLKDYFSIEILEGNLQSMPLVLEGFKPTYLRLERFFNLPLNWNNEAECLEGLLRGLSDLYEGDFKTLFNVIRENNIIIGTNSMKESIVHLTDLNSLYKIFERC